ncbi:MAG: hypothetical protein JSS02_03305 [Planctomycetes bacterium]|nr:hypothetical protein [Planctomycetota bacterium]
MIKNWKRPMFVLTVATIMGGNMLVTGLAQTPDVPARKPAPTPPVAAGSAPGNLAKPFAAPEATSVTGGAGRWSSGMAMLPSADPVRKALTDVRSLKQQYQGAESDDDRKTIRESLRQAISEFFEADLKLRRDRVEALAKRVAALSSVLEKRTAAKQDIVNLQLKAFSLDDADSVGGDGPPAGQAVAGYRTGFGSTSQNSELAVAVREFRMAIAGGEPADLKLATENLRKALEDVLEKDLTTRAKEVDAVRAQVANLTQGLEKRTSRKAEIIDVQLQLALLDADSLGFAGEVPGTISSSSSYFPFSGPPAMGSPAVFPTQAGASPGAFGQTVNRASAGVSAFSGVGTAKDAPTQGILLRGTQFISFDRVVSQVICRESRTGKVLWETSLPKQAGKLQERFDVSDGKITVYDEHNTAFSIDLTDGSLSGPRKE